MQILEVDLDNAIKNGEWNTTTCLIAQARKRVSGKEVVTCGVFSGEFDDNSDFRLSDDERRLQILFDQSRLAVGFDPHKIEQIRAQLPIEV